MIPRYHLILFLFPFFIYGQSEMSYENHPDFNRPIDKTKPVGKIPAQFDVNNGVANYTVPIEIHKGIAGVQPNFSVNYTSSGGDGILGLSFFFRRNRAN